MKYKKIDNIWAIISRPLTYYLFHFISCSETQRHHSHLFLSHLWWSVRRIFPVWDFAIVPRKAPASLAWQSSWSVSTTVLYPSSSHAFFAASQRFLTLPVMSDSSLEFHLLHFQPFSIISVFWLFPAHIFYPSRHIDSILGREFLEIKLSSLPLRPVS